MAGSNAALLRKIRAESNHSNNKEDAGMSDNTNSAHGVSPDYHLQMERGLAKLESSIATSTEALNTLLIKIPGYTGKQVDAGDDMQESDEEGEDTLAKDPFEEMALRVAKIMARKIPTGTGNIRIHTDKVNEVFGKTFERYFFAKQTG